MDLGLNMQGGMLQRIPPTAPREVQISVLNDVIDRLNALLKSQVFSDGTSKRMLIGYQKDGWGVGQDFGIKVSLEGVDVTKATDEQLLFKMALDQWTWRNEEGDLVKKFDIAEGTTYDYNPSNGKNFMQTGKLPDGSYGWAVADEGHDVADGF